MMKVIFKKLKCPKIRKPPKLIQILEVFWLHQPKSVLLINACTCARDGIDYKGHFVGTFEFKAFISQI